MVSPAAESRLSSRVPGLAEAVEKKKGLRVHSHAQPTVRDDEKNKPCNKLWDMGLGSGFSAR